MSKERPKRNIIQKKYVSRASAFCLLLPPDAAALVQVALLVSAKMRKLSSRTAEVPAGQLLRDILLKGSAASWPNVFPFLWLLFKETAVFTRRLPCERFFDIRHVWRRRGARLLREAASLAFRPI